MQPCRRALLLLHLLAATSTSHALDADAAAAAWSTQRGVHAPKLAIRTTTDSVGGRGLFATDAVRKGEVVASIPKDLVWRAPAPADLPPEGRAWQTQLATQLLLAAAAGEEAWAPWLDSLPTDFDGFAYLDCEDVDGWVQETAQRWGLPADRLAETLGERRGAYARRAAWFFSAEGPAALCGASPASFRLASNWLYASCLFASSTDTSSVAVASVALTGAATDAVAFDGFTSTPSLNPALSRCSGAGGVSPCSMKHRSSARLRAISTSYAAPIVAATRSLCSSRSRVSARSILSNLSVSSFAICFRRLITSATLLRSYPARVVLSTLRSPEAFLASRIFCFCPIDAAQSFDATDE